MEKNKFFDINKFPKEEGLLLFPISMSRIDNSQNAVTCLKYIKQFPSKIAKPNVGLNFIYGDFLYLHSDKKAFILKDKFMGQIVNHRNAVQKLLFKACQEFQIQHAFNYLVWNQLYFGSKDFKKNLENIRKIYEKDKLFKQYLREDAKYWGHNPTKLQRDFFLEESLIFYLGAKGNLILPNEYIQGREKWILWCYPGVPPKSMIYLFQLNPFKLKNPQNKYENVCTYNLETQEFYDVSNIDLESYNY